MGLGSTKSIAVLQAEATTEGGASLRRVLTATNLVMLGIGAIIGAGIFVLTGHAAATNAGNGVVFSFMLAFVGCRKILDREHPDQVVDLLVGDDAAHEEQVGAPVAVQPLHHG